MGQLNNLVSHLSKVAPESYALKSVVADTLCSLSRLSADSQGMPSVWIGVESEDVQRILDDLYPGQTTINWRFLIVAGMAAGPCDNLDETASVVKSLIDADSG